MAKTVNNQHSATNEVLSAVKILSDKTDKQFSALSDKTNKEIKALSSKTDKQFEGVLEAMNDFAGQTEYRFNKLENEVTEIKTIMATKSDLAKLATRIVTKDYLDDKMADLRGDLVVLTRKEDTKLKTLVGVLKEKDVLDVNDVKRIYSLEPFAQ